jgi:putative peptidoglycan lipid II flippase
MAEEVKNQAPPQGEGPASSEPQPRTASFAGRFMKAGVAVGAALLLFKLAGLIQARAIGQFLSKETGDVYVFAFENCIFALFLLGEGVIGPALMPVFMRARDSGPEGERRAWRFAGTFLTWQFLILAAAVALLMVFPESVVRLLTSWTPENRPDKFALAVATVRRLAPALLGLSLGSTTYALLNAHKRFFLAAFGDAAWKFTAVAALYLFATRTGDPASVLIAGLVCGSVVKLLLHLWGLRDKLRFLSPSLGVRTEEFRSFALLALPLIAGVVFAIVRDNVNYVYFPSLLTDGMMQANSWGSKLEKVLVMLVPTTLSIAAFPFLCEMAERGDRSVFGDFITKTGRQLLALFLPFAAVIAVLAVPLTSLVFGGGKFDAVSVQRAALAMACYTFALPAVAVETILMKAFFASRRTVAVSVLGIVFSTLSMFISWGGSRLFRENELLVLGVIAGGFALTRWMKTASLAVLFRRSAPAFPAAETASFLVRLILASAAIAGAAYVGRNIGSWLHYWPPIPRGSEPPEWVVNLAELGLGGLAALIALVASFALLRIREPMELLRLILSRKTKHGTIDMETRQQ